MIIRIFPAKRAARVGVVAGVLLALAIGLAIPSMAWAQAVSPDDPYRYLIRIDQAFKEFWKRYHYYPSYWFDMTANCREEPRERMCDVENERTAHDRRIIPLGVSQYSYEIVRSSRSSYRVVALNVLGKPQFYIDELGHVRQFR